MSGSKPAARMAHQLAQAYSGAASPRSAIKAMCLQCTGFDREAIRNCSSWACPLWQYRAFKAGDGQEASEPAAA